MALVRRPAEQPTRDDPQEVEADRIGWTEHLTMFVLACSLGSLAVLVSFAVAMQVDHWGFPVAANALVMPLPTAIGAYGRFRWAGESAIGQTFWTWWIVGCAPLTVWFIGYF